MKWNQNPLFVLALSSAMATVAAGQTSIQAPSAGTTDGVAQPPQTLPAVSQAAQPNPSDNSTFATGKPLAGESKEGFWGKVNPFARKKWVNRQVDPIKDRTNELDQLQAKNASDIRDVDSRSQAGINKAIASSNTADQHAADARSRADAAQGVATDSSNRTNTLSGTVSNLDQYQTVSTVPVVFVSGRTTLGPKGRAELDELAKNLASQKGYLLEVQGYSSGGVQTSQAMADSVVRYLVVEHQVPVYRIYRTGLGRNTQRAAGGEKPLTNGVVVSLMHNSLATMGGPNASLSPASNMTIESGASPVTGVSRPDAN